MLYMLGLQTVTRKEPYCLSRAGLRAARGQNSLHYCVRFIVYTQFTNVAAGRLIQDGGPRVGDPCLVPLINYNSMHYLGYPKRQSCWKGCFPQFDQLHEWSLAYKHCKLMRLLELFRILLRIQFHRGGSLLSRSDFFSENGQVLSFCADMLNMQVLFIWRVRGRWVSS